MISFLDLIVVDFVSVGKIHGLSVSENHSFDHARIEDGWQHLKFDVGYLPIFGRICLDHTASAVRR